MQLMHSLSGGDRCLFSFLLGTSSNVCISPMSMPSAILRTFSMTCEPYLCGSKNKPCQECSHKGHLAPSPTPPCQPPYQPSKPKSLLQFLFQLGFQYLSTCPRQTTQPRTHHRIKPGHLCLKCRTWSHKRAKEALTLLLLRCWHRT